MDGKKSFEYREWLSDELKRRQRTNARYSLRSFAKTLELSPAFLSKVINGKKNISVKNAIVISQRLGFSEMEQRTFCQSVAREPLSQKGKAILSTADNDADNTVAILLELEAFQVIADWHHFALRELVRTKDFRSDPEWLSKRLGIPKNDASVALKRLVKLNLVELKRGRWRKTETLIATPSGVPSRALKSHHSQMIDRAKAAIESQTIHERDITGITISTHPDKVEQVRSEIKKFRRKMARLLDTEDPSEVYQLNVQLFRLTEPTIKRNKDEKSV